MAQKPTEQELSVANQNLLGNLDVKTIVGFDGAISDLFTTVFYSLSADVAESTDTSTSSSSSTGIVTHLLKNWKKTVGLSSISKTLPAVITGSIIEGASLSRLFHPSHETNLELEADIMYVMGCIDQATATTCLQDIETTGFLKVKYTPEISLFTDDKVLSMQDMIGFDPMDGIQYLDGTMMKTVHEGLQSHDQHIQLDDNPYVVSIKQKRSGPSSEILFESHKIVSKNDLKRTADFLIDLKDKMDTLESVFVSDVRSLRELSLILDSALEALEDVARRRALQIEPYQLDSSEVDEMKRQLSEILSHFIKTSETLSDRFHKFNELIHDVTAICHVVKTKDFQDSIFGLFEKEPTTSARSLTKETEVSISNSKYYSDNGMRGDVASMRLMLDNHITLISIYPEELKHTVHLKEALVTKSQSMIKMNKSPDACQNFDITISFDNVSCFYCSFWPEIASEWPKRDRYWPSNENVEEIVKAGCYIVSKQSQEGVAHRFEWRWSFSSAEIALANHRTPTMKYCYFVYKSLFYRYLKGPKSPNTKSLPSYIVKTCMLHVSEQHNEIWWEGSDPGAISWCVLELFRYLQECLKAGFLAHYFISDLNLLADLPAEIVKKALAVTSEILICPLQYLRYEEEKVHQITSIQEEVVSLYAVNNVDAGADQKVFNRERYETVTDLFRECVETTAAMFRAKYMCDYYNTSTQKENLAEVMEFQEIVLSCNQESSAIYVLTKKEHSINQESLTKMVKKLESLKENGKSYLKKFAYLIKKFCAMCDVCCQFVPCQTDRFRCAESECDYDVCFVCHDSLTRNTTTTTTTTTTTAKHKHPLTPTSECSPYCYTQYTHERLGRGNRSADVTTECALELMNVGRKMVSLLAQIGLADKEKSASPLNRSCVFKAELSKLLQSLEVVHEKAIDVDGMELCKNLSPANGDGNKKDDTPDCPSNYEEDLILLKSRLAEVKKRELILELVFP